MGREELIESLRKAGEEQVRLIWEEAEREADLVRANTARRMEKLRAESTGVKSAAADAESAAAVAEAENRARAQRLLAEQELVTRMFSAAVVLLRGLRDERYPELFEKLAQELPPLTWKTAALNPEDGSLARKYFPGAELTLDPAITGGMDVAVEGGALRVINTFEKRLERAWPELLSFLIKDVHEEVSDGPSSAS